jgi:hypothetical protein
VIAKQAAQLGVMIAGAAREFTEALAGGSAMPSVPAIAPSGAETIEPMLDASEQPAATGTLKRRAGGGR